MGAVARPGPSAPGQARRVALVHRRAGRLSDNPDLPESGYAAVLAGLPEELRRVGPRKIWVTFLYVLGAFRLNSEDRGRASCQCQNIKVWRTV
jgi:hypothetical protein